MSGDAVSEDVPHDGGSEGPGASALDYLRATLQYAAPKHALSALALRASHARVAPWKNALIRWFTRRYGVNLDEARETSPDAYPHFNAFFTRALRDGARPIEGGEHTLVSPADGSISQLGRIADGSLLQAKGRHYRVDELLGADLAGEASFASGHFATVYLSPRDYHRVHMPLAGRLRAMNHLPGALFSVNPATTRVVPRLFARNERVASLFDTAHGPMAIVLVGAVLVGGMETVWAGQVTPPHGAAKRTWRYAQGDDAGVRLARGEEMGRFNMGSTVVVLLPDIELTWTPGLRPGSDVRLGESIAELGSAGAA